MRKWVYRVSWQETEQQLQDALNGFLDDPNIVHIGTTPPEADCPSGYLLVVRMPAYSPSKKQT